MNMMQIAAQAVDALPAGPTPFAAVVAPEQGRGFDKLLHERRKAVADAGGNTPESSSEATLQGTPQGSDPALPVLKEEVSPLAVLPAEEKTDAMGEDTDLTQVVDPMSAAMQVVAAVTKMTAEAGAPVMEPERQADAITAANREGSSANPAQPQQIQARAGDDATGPLTVAEAARQGIETWGEVAPEVRGNAVQRPLVAAAGTETTSAGLQAEQQLSPDVATAGKPSLAQPATPAPAESAGRTAAGLSVQQEIADRLAVSKNQLPSRQPAAEQESTGEVLRQEAPARTEAPQQTREVAQQPVVIGTAQQAASDAAQQATKDAVQQATKDAMQQATTSSSEQQAKTSITQPATGQTAQPADSAPQAAAAAIGGQERKPEARPGQAKGEGQRQELRAAAEEPLKAASGEAVTKEHPAVQPQGALNVAADADHSDGHGAKDAPRKVVGVEGAGEVVAGRAPQVEQPAQPQSAAKGTREEGALHRDVLAQIKQGTMVHDGKGNGTMSIRLNPGELGELKIQVHMADNRFKVEVHAENRTVKDLLMNNLDSLKEALSGKDLAMEGFDVSTGGGDFFGRQAEQRESLRQQAMPKPVRLAGYEAVEERRFNYTTPAGGGLLDLRL